MSSPKCSRLFCLAISALGLMAQDASTPGPVKVGGEFRGRVDRINNLNFTQAGDGYWINRLRVHASASPRPWLQLYLEAQDARQAGWNEAVEGSGLANHADIRQAYVGLGSETGVWHFRAGRQELSIGDERLVGADNAWDPLGRSWDAARVSYRQTSWRIDAFAALLVGADWRGMDRPQTGDRLYGVHASLPSGQRGPKIEPYFLVDDLRAYCRLADRKYGRRVYTGGAKAAGPLPMRLNYAVEFALQGGYFADRPHRAWAGHWELGHQTGGDDRSPRLIAEYNYASGDRDPEGSVHRTFDDLHPAGYNKFGASDPFAWRNTNNVGGSLEWQFAKRAGLKAGLRSFHLASRADGLYTLGEACLVERFNARSSDVGRQALASLTFAVNQRLELAGGYARFFPGGYLREASASGPLNTPFLQLLFRF